MPWLRRYALAREDVAQIPADTEMRFGEEIIHMAQLIKEERRGSAEGRAAAIHRLPVNLSWMPGIS